MIDVANLRKEIITLTGTPCSGKSTLNKKLAEALGYTSESIGSLVKQWAKETGVDPEEFY